MKDLKSILKESIFDDDMDVYNGIKDEIKKFIEYNYECNKGFIISDNPNKNGKYEVSTDGDVNVTNKNITSLTNDLFEWSKVDGYFECGECSNLKSLKGAPKSVKKTFYCDNCPKLKTLEGAPKEVGKDFNYNHCKSLKSLKGAPKKVGGNFFCRLCNSEFTEDDVRKVSKVKGNIYC